MDDSLKFVRECWAMMDSSESKLLRIKVKTDSMLPSVYPGEICWFCIKKFSPRIGDVILFENQGVLVCHRVLDIEGKYVITKGDNCRRPDPFTTHINNVFGVLVPEDNRHKTWRAFFQLIRLYLYRVAPSELLYNYFNCHT